MNTYYIRCIEQDYPVLLQLGEILGVIKKTEDGVIPLHNGSWDYIGEIPVPTGNVLKSEEGFEYPETKPKTDPDGNVYLHVNLITPLSLWEEANKLDALEVKDALSNLGRFFLLDAEGNARLPNNPYRVFA